MAKKKVKYYVDRKKVVDDAIKNQQQKTEKDENTVHAKLFKLFELVGAEYFIDYIHKEQPAVLMNMIDTLTRETRTTSYPIEKVTSPFDILTIASVYDQIGKYETASELLRNIMKDRCKDLGISQADYCNLFGISKSSENKRFKGNKKPKPFIIMKSVAALKCDSDLAEIIVRLMGFCYRPYEDIDQVMISAMDSYHHLEYEEYAIKLREHLKKYGFDLNGRYE